MSATASPTSVTLDADQCEADPDERNGIADQRDR